MTWTDGCCHGVRPARTGRVPRVRSHGSGPTAQVPRLRSHGSGPTGQVPRVRSPPPLRPDNRRWREGRPRSEPVADRGSGRMGCAASDAAHPLTALYRVTAALRTVVAWPARSLRRPAPKGQKRTRPLRGSAPRKWGGNNWRRLYPSAHFNTVTKTRRQHHESGAPARRSSGRRRHGKWCDVAPGCRPHAPEPRATRCPAHAGRCDIAAGSHQCQRSP
jgi:hypothetical protein